LIRNVNACYTGHYALLLFIYGNTILKSPFSGYSNSIAAYIQKIGWLI